MQAIVQRTWTWRKHIHAQVKNILTWTIIVFIQQRQNGKNNPIQRKPFNQKWNMNFFYLKWLIQRGYNSTVNTTQYHNYNSDTTSVKLNFYFHVMRYIMSQWDCNITCQHECTSHEFNAKNPVKLYRVQKTSCNVKHITFTTQYLDTITHWRTCWALRCHENKLPQIKALLTQKRNFHINIVNLT